jgi:formamidopyrimidine-DNA glycosylase
MWALQDFDFQTPVFGCSLQANPTQEFGFDPCQNALLAFHLELYAFSNEATQKIPNPLMDEGYIGAGNIYTICVLFLSFYIREQSTEKCSKLAMTRNYELIWLASQSPSIRRNKLCWLCWHLAISRNRNTFPYGIIQ